MKSAARPVAATHILTSTPASVKAGSNDNRWRSEPPMPLTFCMCKTLMLEQLRVPSGSCRLEGFGSISLAANREAYRCYHCGRARSDFPSHAKTCLLTRRRPEPSGTSEDAGGFWRDRGWRARLARTTVATWIGAGLTMLSVVVAARALGPESYGAVVLALSVTAVAARFLDFTFGEAVVHHGHRARATGDISGLRALLRMSLMLDIAIGVAVAAILVLLAAPLAGIAGDMIPRLCDSQRSEFWW